MLTDSPLYKIPVSDKLEPLGWDLYLLRNMIAQIQKRLPRLVLIASQRVRKFLSDRGAPSFILAVDEDSYKGPKQFFVELETALKSAKNVWMCVGEMGARLMERTEVIDGIVFAFEKNGAEIKIIHGPRTDPKTSKIFDLAGKGVVKLYELPYYPNHHFLYFVSTADERLLIDESPHLEPVRAVDQEGKFVEFYRSFHRMFYVIKQPNWLGELRFRQATKRMKQADRHRSLKVGRPSRGYPLLSIFLNYVFYIIPYSLILQPLLVSVDRILSPWDNAQTNNQKRGVAMGETHRSTSKEFVMKLEKGLVVTGISGGFVLLSGVVLETFLKIPLANTSIYVPVGITSAVVGAAIGKFLNKE